MKKYELLWFRKQIYEVSIDNDCSHNNDIFYGLNVLLFCLNDFDIHTLSNHNVKVESFLIMLNYMINMMAQYEFRHL
jgi:hypothetical protein